MASSGASVAAATPDVAHAPNHATTINTLPSSASAIETSSIADKPTVLIIGGLGDIGRNLALHIHKNNLASEVRLIDKQLPELAWLAPEFKEACRRELFVQADASREQSFPRIFDRTDNKPFDYVFNCGGETRFSQDDQVYKLRGYDLSIALGREAAKRHVKCFVECSTGMVYKPDRSPRKESDRKKPGLKLAKWKLQAEEDLAKIEGLNLVLLRFALVYGPYVSKFLSTALCMARVYQHLGKEMKWLWDKDLPIHTVHVEDVARALWTSALWYTEKRTPSSTIPEFNIVDHGRTSTSTSSSFRTFFNALLSCRLQLTQCEAQGLLANLVHSQFSIPTGFHGTIISTFARLNLDDVVEDVNDELLDPWAALQQKAGITRATPITPFLEKEVLRDLEVSLDGSLFEKTTGFQYQKQSLGPKELVEVIDSYKRMEWWP